MPSVCEYISMKVRTEDIFGKFLEAVHHDMIKVTLTGE